jgi:hypothetical protein
MIFSFTDFWPMSGQQAVLLIEARPQANIWCGRVQSMRRFAMTRVFFWLAVLLVLVSSVLQAQSPGAPRIYDIEFVRGVFEDTASVQPSRPCSPEVPQGVCGNGNSKGYSLEGKAGDFITISIGSKTGAAVFSIFTPSGEILKNGSARDWWAGRLPADGDYRINVYTSKSYTPFDIRFTRSR